MKKLLLRIIPNIMILVLSLSFTSLAGSWESVDDDWKYKNDDGSYVADAWLPDNGAYYYFDSNGLMLKNTLSPDGFPLARDGKRLSNTEILPLSFPGTKSEFLAYYDTVMEFLKGYHARFNDTYDEIYPRALEVYKNKNFEEVRAAIDYMDTFDFTPYMASDYVGVRKFAVSDEIFRIEQTYYMYELAKATEREDSAYCQAICDRMYLSVDKYGSDIEAFLDRSILWNEEF